MHSTLPFASSKHVPVISKDRLARPNTSEVYKYTSFTFVRIRIRRGIQHSDPQRLKELTDDQAFAEKLHDAEWLLQRRKDIKETMDYMQQANPSETDLMVQSIGALNGTSIGLRERVAELKSLVHMVEPIDNANDLPTMGKLAPCVLGSWGFQAIRRCWLAAM